MEKIHYYVPSSSLFKPAVVFPNSLPTMAPYFLLLVLTGTIGHQAKPEHFLRIDDSGDNEIYKTIYPGMNGLF